MSKIIISTITFNCLKYTKLCLKYIKSTCSYPHEILVVDNGSIDGTVEWLKTQDVTLIENGKNLGYAYAHNNIYDYAWKDDPETLLILLSNDMLPLPHAIDDLIEAAETSDVPIISGETLSTPVYCSMYPEDRRFFAGGDRITVDSEGYGNWSNGRMYSLIEETADEFVASASSKLLPTLPPTTLIETGSFSPPGHRVYRKSYFDAIGYFDANFYPIYSVDFDYTMRASLTGQNVHVVQSSLCLEFWSRCIYEGSVVLRDVRRDDYYREKWGPHAAYTVGWSIPFNGSFPAHHAGYDTSQVRISSREGELERVTQLMGYAQRRIIGR